MSSVPRAFSSAERRTSLTIGVTVGVVAAGLVSSLLAARFSGAVAAPPPGITDAGPGRARGAAARPGRQRRRGGAHPRCAPARRHDGPRCDARGECGAGGAAPCARPQGGDGRSLRLGPRRCRGRRADLRRRSRYAAQRAHLRRPAHGVGLVDRHAPRHGPVGHGGLRRRHRRRARDDPGRHGGPHRRRPLRGARARARRARGRLVRPRDGRQRPRRPPRRRLAVARRSARARRAAPLAR